MMFKTFILISFEQYEYSALKPVIHLFVNFAKDSLTSNFAQDVCAEYLLVRDLHEDPLWRRGMLSCCLHLRKVFSTF